MIKEVERVSPDFELDSFYQQECLGEAHIQIAPRGADQGIAIDRSECSRCRCGKCGRIEPLTDRTVRHRWVGHLIRKPRESTVALVCRGAAQILAIV
jgi:hypothetical protein